MKKIALILASICVALTANAITIFDDFGAGNTYNQTLGWTLGGSGSTDAVAAQFVAGGTGFLSQVDLGVTFLNQGSVSAFLYADAAGTPDNAIQIFLGSGTPTAAFGSTNNTILSFSVSNVVPVTIGTTYWMVLKIADPDTQLDAWNLNSVGAMGTVETTQDGTTWGTVTDNRPGAFRLLASELPPVQPGNGVPDSGGTLAMLAGAMAVLFALHRSGAVFARSQILD